MAIQGREPPKRKNTFKSDLEFAEEETPVEGFGDKRRSILGGALAASKRFRQSKGFKLAKQAAEKQRQAFEDRKGEIQSFLKGEADRARRERATETERLGAARSEIDKLRQIASGEGGLAQTFAQRAKEGVDPTLSEDLQQAAEERAQAVVDPDFEEQISKQQARLSQQGLSGSTVASRGTAELREQQAAQQTKARLQAEDQLRQASLRAQQQELQGLQSALGSVGAQQERERSLAQLASSRQQAAGQRLRQLGPSQRMQALNQLRQQSVSPLRQIARQKQQDRITALKMAASKGAAGQQRNIVAPATKAAGRAFPKVLELATGGGGSGSSQD